MSRWYRAYEGTVTDAKLAEAAMIAEVSRSVSIAAWHCLLESAATVNNCGSYETSARRVAIVLCEPVDRIDALFAAYEEIGLIGKGAVSSWKKRQFVSDSSAERVAKHRAKKKQETGKGNGSNADVTLHNAPYTETETDSSEPKGSSPRPWALPVGVSLQVWTDFLKNRKRKRQSNTATAWKKFTDDLARVSIETGIPPPNLIEQCTAKGWGGIYDPREDDGQQRNGSNGLRGSRPDPALDLYRAAVAEEQRENGAADRRVGSSLPAIGSG